MTSKYDHLADPEFPHRKPVDAVLYPEDSAVGSVAARTPFDPHAPIHQSALTNDDAAYFTNPHGVDNAVARRHADAADLGYDGPVVPLQRSGPNCL